MDITAPLDLPTQAELLVLRDIIVPQDLLLQLH